MADNKSPLKDYNDVQAQRYAKYREQKDKEEKIKFEQEEKIKFEQEEKIRLENEKIRLENEEKLIKEMQYFEEFEYFLDQLEMITLEIHNAISITEIDMTVISFMSLLESNQHFMENNSLKQQTAGKVIQIINSISQNENSKFDVTIKDDNEAAKRITENTKTILKLVDYDDSGINFELMDTGGDEEVAKKIHEEENKNNIINDGSVAKKFHSGIGKMKNKFKTSWDRGFESGHSLMDNVNIKPSIPDYVHPTIDNMDNLTNFTNQVNSSGYVDPDFPDYTENDLLDYPENDLLDYPENKVSNNLTYYAGFDNIDDPDLVQMLHYQNELMDDNK